MERVAPERKLRCGPPRLGAGGGGINVSRAIRKLGGTSLAVYVRGGPPGEMLERMLADEGVEQRPIEAEGWTRENFAVLELSTNAQYRFNLAGSRDELMRSAGVPWRRSRRCCRPSQPYWWRAAASRRVRAGTSTRERRVAPARRVRR